MQITYLEDLEITPNEFFEMGRVGVMMFQQGQIDKAQTIFEGLIELDPRNAAAHSALGAIYTLKKVDVKAIKHLQQAILLDSEQIAPYVNLGEINLRRGNLEEGIANLKTAIELDPNENHFAARRARIMVHKIFQIVSLKNN